MPDVTVKSIDEMEAIYGGLARRARAELGVTPEQLNELGEEGWEAVGLSLKYGDLIAWPVVLLKRPLS